LPGFSDIIVASWATTTTNVDPFRVFNLKLRNVAKALRSWSNTKIGSVHLQLAMATEVILRFDEAQECNALLQWEADLHKTLKLRVLGLTLLARTITRQRSRLLFLVEGNANTRFYHLQACHRSHKSRIDSFRVQGIEVVSDTAMAAALYDHFNEVLGSNFERSRRFDMHACHTPIKGQYRVHTSYVRPRSSRTHKLTN
jgi:hypothetical protein